MPEVEAVQNLLDARLDTEDFWAVDSAIVLERLALIPADVRSQNLLWA